MGVQLSTKILEGTGVAIGVGTAVRGLHLYTTLPSQVAVPLKFGLWGEALNFCEWKAAFFVYPGIGLFLASAPAFATPCTIPPWVRDADAYRSIFNLFQQIMTVGVGSMILTITEQVPKIMRKQQRTLVPEGLVVGYLAAFGGVLASFYGIARRVAS
eukprot:TRINITY_DN11323_c0_g1_i1.p2 TRINITY_DN11323_c0_g1~~TRINITY_DN11323_c0_g1_i1.p2  ORF type:complete len:157 (-),score=24.66 TRINITY_DN11323_c0_g1_i1:184-654(-)